MDYPRQKKMAVWWLLRVVHQDMLVGHASGHAIAFDNNSLVRHAKKWDWGFCCSERDLSCFYLCWSCFIFFFFFGTKLETKPTLSWLLGLPKKTRQFLPLTMAVFFPELFEVVVKLDYEWSRETRDWLNTYTRTRLRGHATRGYCLKLSLLPRVAWRLILRDAFCPLIHFSPK